MIFRDGSAVVYLLQPPANRRLSRSCSDVACLPIPQRTTSRSRRARWTCTGCTLRKRTRTRYEQSRCVGVPYPRRVDVVRSTYTDYCSPSSQDGHACGLHELRLIVGKGNRSLSGIAKIKPAVCSFLQRIQLSAQVDQRNSGVLIVQL